MIKYLGFTTTQVFWIVILSIVVCSLYHLLMMIEKIRKNNKMIFSFIEFLVSFILMQEWNNNFRDTDIVSPWFFWTVCIILVIFMVVGLLKTALSVMSADANHR